MDTGLLPGLLTSTYIQVVRVSAHGRRYPPASAATARFVGQALDALLQKPLHPLIDKASADPDCLRNGGDRHAVRQE
jgi:hypothetical protein